MVTIPKGGTIAELPTRGFKLLKGLCIQFGDLFPSGLNKDMSIYIPGKKPWLCANFFEATVARCG